MEPQGVESVSMVLLLLLAIVVLALVAGKIGVPYPTVMVIGGLLICLVSRGDHLPFDPKVFTIEPKIIFLLFLPPLL